MNKLSRLARTPLPLALLLALATGCGQAQAQSSCASDGVPRPAVLLERFINADCDACWRDARSARPARGELALDWIVPGTRGEDAPLSAVASRDSLARLESLGRKIPVRAQDSRRKSRPQGTALRVAHGLALGGYVGASIEFRPPDEGPWQAWLLLVETLPAGTEGSPVERNLVRNVLQVAWDKPQSLSKEEQPRFLESRPMNLPEGVQPQRLRVVGWVEDARGHIRAIAQSRCTVAGSKG